MHRRLLLALTLGLVLVASACAQDDPTDTADSTESPQMQEGVTLAIGDVSETLGGNVLDLPVEVEGVEIVQPDGDDSGETGHFHVFVDGDPPGEGEVIERGAGIIHSFDNPVRIWGLEGGEHTFTVVLGNGKHERIHEDVVDEVTVNVEGPWVNAEAPAEVDSGEDLTINIESDGVEIMAADGDESGDSGHYHVLVDPAAPPAPGDVVPAAEENKIVHTTEDSVTISDLAEGEHTIYVVVGDGKHQVLDPLVGDRFTVTVG